MRRLFSNSGQAISGPVLFVVLAAAVTYYAVHEVRKGVHALGCKVHIIHAAKCSPVKEAQ